MGNLPGRLLGTITKEMEPYGGSCFVFFKAVLRVGAQAFFPFKRLFEMKHGDIAWAPFGNNNKGEAIIGYIVPYTFPSFPILYTLLLLTAAFFRVFLVGQIGKIERVGSVGCTALTISHFPLKMPFKREDGKKAFP